MGEKKRNQQWEEGRMHVGGFIQNVVCPYRGVLTSERECGTSAQNSRDERKICHSKKPPAKVTCLKILFL